MILPGYPTLLSI